MEKESLSKSLQKLEAISNWFDGQEEVDVEEGLQKVKEGASLIKSSRKRLKEIENEFMDVKKDLGEDLS
jgi:exonuclease VII small subunit